MANRQAMSVSQSTPVAYTGFANRPPEPNAMALTTTRAMPAARVRSTVARVSEPRASRRRPFGPTRTLGLVTELTERAVAARVPSLVAEPLSVVGRRQPVTVAAGLVHRGLPAGDPAHRDRRFGVRDGRLGTAWSASSPSATCSTRLVGEDVASGVDLAAPVETYMTTDPRTLRLDQSVRDALELMQSGRYRNVPVVDDDRRLIGVVRQVDLLKYLAESFPEELLNLPPRPHQRMEQAEGG